jgi:hypothetical protein
MKPLAVAVVLGSGLALSACSGSSAPSTMGVLPALAAGTATLSNRSSNRPVASPVSLAFVETGQSAARRVTLREPGNDGAYTLSDRCKDVARFTLSKHETGVTTYIATPLHFGQCRIRFVDVRNHGVSMVVTVTTTAIALSSASVSPHAGSAVVSAGRMKAVSRLSSCAQGCVIAAPPLKKGNVRYDVAVYTGADGTGSLLARGSVISTTVEGKRNVFPAQPLRIPATATFGTLPSGTGGVAFAPVPVSLEIRDAGGDTIPGEFESAVTIADDDASSLVQEGSYLSLDGSPGRSFSLSQAPATFAFGYGGLAIPAAHITAKFGSTVIGQTQFSPSVPAVAYVGPLDAAQLPEIDLYSTQAGQPGYASSFSLSQTGWSISPYSNSFTFVPSGTNDDCSSFVVTPSGSSAYTVHPVASPQPGLCTMMLTGGSSASSTPLILTYTVPTPIHVSATGVRP